MSLQREQQVGRWGAVRPGDSRYPLILKVFKINDSKNNSTQFTLGSHLMVDFGFYQHHGIASGDERVVHFGRGIFDLKNAVVENVSLEGFCQGNPIQVVDSKSNYTSEEIVTRALNRTGESGYDLFENNCEHFVNWCRCGEHESQQVNLTESVVRQTAAVCAKPLIRKLALKAASGRMGLAAAGVARGPAAAVASVADIAQATAEILAVKHGMTKDHTRRIGRNTGIFSSAALGWVVGGPATAVAGVGFWCFGQVLGEKALQTGKQVVSFKIDQTTANS